MKCIEMVMDKSYWPFINNVFYNLQMIKNAFLFSFRYGFKIGVHVKPAIWNPSLIVFHL